MNCPPEPDDRRKPAEPIDAELDAMIQASIARILARVDRNRTITERNRQRDTGDA